MSAEEECNCDQAPKLRADLARVTEERDEAREERDRLAAYVGGRKAVEAVAAAAPFLARIRAEAEAAALERAGVEDLWPVVIRFAQLMQRKLNENRHKGDREAWLGDDPASLVRRVNEEAHELGQAVLRLIIEDFDGRDGLRPHVAAEAADVANMAMMVWDSCAREDIPDASAPIRALANGKDGGE